MILVKKRYLYILTLLFCFLVIFGEIKFFFALKSVNQATNLELKYEIENFIFASIVLLLVVFFFLINFIRMSTNVLKRMDKMIELSSYGKYDVGEHLKKMGELGERVNYLVYHLNNLNNMKSLKISSLARMNDFFIKRSADPLFLMDRYGKIVDCSERLPETVKAGRDSFVGREFNDIFKEVNSDEILFDLEKSRKAIAKEGLEMELNGKKQKLNMTFHPIINADDIISHVIGAIE